MKFKIASIQLQNHHKDPRIVTHDCTNAVTTLLEVCANDKDVFSAIYHLSHEDLPTILIVMTFRKNNPKEPITGAKWNDPDNRLANEGYIPSAFNLTPVLSLNDRIALGNYYEGSDQYTYEQVMDAFNKGVIAYETE